MRYTLFVRHFNTAGPCRPDLHYMIEQLGLDEGVLVIFDRRTDAADPESRTRFEEAVTPKGRNVVVLRA